MTCRKQLLKDRITCNAWPSTAKTVSSRSFLVLAAVVNRFCSKCTRQSWSKKVLLRIKLWLSISMILTVGICARQVNCTSTFWRNARTPAPIMSLLTKSKCARVFRTYCRAFPDTEIWTSTSPVRTPFFYPVNWSHFWPGDTPKFACRPCLLLNSTKRARMMACQLMTICFVTCKSEDFLLLCLIETIPGPYKTITTVWFLRSFSRTSATAWRSVMPHC